MRYPRRVLKKGSHEKTIVDCCVLALTAAGQETRREITNAAANPADDKKGLSDKVPDVSATSSQFDRVVLLRFKFDTDLLAGLQKMVKQEKISNGIILSGMGSVRGYQVHQVSNRSFPSKNMFVKNPTEPADIVGMSGFISNGDCPPAHHAGHAGEGVRRTSGARDQRLHVRVRDHWRVEGRRGFESRG